MTKLEPFPSRAVRGKALNTPSLVQLDMTNVFRVSPAPKLQLLPDHPPSPVGQGWAPAQRDLPVMQGDQQH